MVLSPFLVYLDRDCQQTWLLVELVSALFPIFSCWVSYNLYLLQINYCCGWGFPWDWARRRCMIPLYYLQVQPLEKSNFLMNLLIVGEFFLLQIFWQCFSIHFHFFQIAFEILDSLPHYQLSKSHSLTFTKLLDLSSCCSCCFQPAWQQIREHEPGFSEHFSP